MGDKTGIAWTDRTWNPWYGCSKVSPGCAHCYMFREQKQYGRNPDVVTRSKTKFSEPLAWERAANPRTNGGVAVPPVKVFTCSWSDWFHEAADGWRDEAWEIVYRTPHLHYQILTKRPHRIAAHLPRNWGAGYTNVWLGVSIENNHWLERAETLAEIPAAVRFWSCEPLLAPLVGRHGKGIASYLTPGWGKTGHAGYQKPVNWVIVGGESGGREARPMDLEWARGLLDACRHTQTPAFVKQLGSCWAREHKAQDWHGGDPAEWPEWLRVREFPEVAAPVGYRQAVLV